MITSAPRMPLRRSWWTSPQAAASARQQGRRADQADARAEGAQGVDVRARHAAVQDVADDGDRQAVEAADVVADGEQVEQRLGRVLVRAVAGVDHRAVDALARKCGARRRRGGA